MSELLEINPGLDLEALAKEYKKKTRIQIPDFLTEESAERLYRTLTEKTPWVIVYNEGKNVKKLKGSDLQAMTGRRQRELAAKIYERATNEFQFLYFSYPMLDAYMEERDPGHLLHHFMEFWNSQKVLDTVRKITGEDKIIKGDAQASWYKADHFLTNHNDKVSAEHRLAAYTLHMTKDWKPDWGGYLQFYDDKGDIEKGFLPRFNTLNLFTVPQDHSVSYVTPFARGLRLAITGWFREK